MGLGDLFKATENERLRNENQHLRDELERFKKKFAELAKENETLRIEGTSEQSFPFHDVTERIAESYADLLCKQIGPYYSSTYSYTGDRRANPQLKAELKEKLSLAFFAQQLIHTFPQIEEAFRGKTSKEFDYLVKVIGVVSNFSWEEQRALMDNHRAYEIRSRKLEADYASKYAALQAERREMEALQLSREQEWSRLVAQHKTDIETILSGNVRALPYVAAIASDYVVAAISDMEHMLGKRYTDAAHEKEIKLRPIKSACRDITEQAKLAIYQMEYLRTLYPNIDDVLDTNYLDLPFALNIDSHADPVSQWVTKTEYETLTENERNQLALDRYIESRNKTKWQIGRDYELSVGYSYEKHGYDVDYYGSFNGIEDLGRDLIVKKGSNVEIVQCKYWAFGKQIHEKHIFQLYGTMLTYAIENGLDPKKVKGVFITNIAYSSTAIKFADMLGIELQANVPFEEFPRIKCNIAADGERIYHLPMDQQYDTVKLDKPGETKVFKVTQATHKGFRRAWRWYGGE